MAKQVQLTLMLFASVAITGCTGALQQPTEVPAPIIHDKPTTVDRQGNPFPVYDEAYKAQWDDPCIDDCHAEPSIETTV